MHGGKVVLAGNIGPEEAFALIERERITFTALVPALLNLWLEVKEWEDADISSLRFIEAGGSAVDPGMAARVEPARLQNGQCVWNGRRAYLHYVAGR